MRTHTHSRLQNLKDAIMVTTAGAETLPFLASCIVLPASLAFFMLYGKMVEALPSVREWAVQDKAYV